jgi:GNAT superfamily N-acetyltransferase
MDLPAPERRPVPIPGTGVVITPAPPWPRLAAGVCSTGSTPPCRSRFTTLALIVSIRIGTRADLAGVAALEASQDTAAWLGETGPGWHERAVADPGQEHLIAEQGGRLAGYAVLAGLRDTGRGVELRRMAVDPGLRGTGLGRGLLRAAVARPASTEPPASGWTSRPTTTGPGPYTSPRASPQPETPPWLSPSPTAPPANFSSCPCPCADARLFALPAVHDPGAKHVTDWGFADRS